MRADVIVLPNDAGNTGKRHAALTSGEGAAMTYTPRVAPHTDPGVLDGEYTLRQAYSATTAPRYLVLFMPPDAGLEAEVVLCRWKLRVSVAQAMASWVAYVFYGAASVQADSEAGSIVAGRGKSRIRKAVVSLQSVAVGGAYTQHAIFQQFREALAVTPASGIQREVDVIEDRAPSIYLPAGGALVLTLLGAPVAGQFEAQITLAWREWLL